MKLLKLLLINGIVFICLFLQAEFITRVYVDGSLRQAWISLQNEFAQTPYSKLGAMQWLLSDPELGYRLNPAHPDINRFSIRHGDLEIPKPPGRQRLLVLGDSIAWDRPGLVDYLEESLRGHSSLEIINASVPGYTTYQELLFLKQWLLPLEPDCILLIHCLNDHHRFLHTFDAEMNFLMTPEARRSLRTRTIWDRMTARSYLLSRLQLEWRMRGELRQVRQDAFPWENRPDMANAWKPEKWEEFGVLLEEMKSVAAQRGAKLCVVSVPFEPQLDAGLLRRNREYVLLPQSQMDTLCTRLNVPLLDLFPVFFQPETGSALFRDGIHLTEAGHRLAADKIAGFLNQLTEWDSYASTQDR
ncbi:MAG: hypothetical protein JW937_07105 [Candidatus Omnitrophica bacterium]|nr:hypothetical protein [Candidatus Omnitrophota bacterium]